MIALRGIWIFICGTCGVGAKTFLDLEDLVVHLLFREIRNFSFHTVKFRIQIIGCPVFIPVIFSTGEWDEY